MTTLSSKIAKLIAAATALEAPLFGLDLIQAGATAAEARRDQIMADFDAGKFVSTDDEPFASFVAPTEDVDADLKILEDAAAAAWVFITNRFLPDEITGVVNSREEQINNSLIEGYRVAKSYTGE